jgi:DNA-binding transcriptional LysR family regulator
MELRRLRYFLRIAAEGSLGKASRALGIAQPALGRQVQLLESELGVTLFRRVAKGMLLTDEGEYLKEALEHPLQQVDIALQNVRSYSARVEASLTLGLTPTMAGLLGSRVLEQLSSELPNLMLRITEGSSTQLASEVCRGLVDIALVVDAAPDTRAFHSEILAEQLMLVGPPNAFAMLGGKTSQPLQFKQLEDLPLILPGPHSALRTKLTKTAAGAEAAVTPVLEIDSVPLVKNAVRAGTGFTILPPVAFSAEAGRGELLGRPIAGLKQTLFWAVQPHWRVPRSTYNEVERIIFEELYRSVASGEWPAEWTLDLARLSLPLRLEVAAQA